MMVLVTGDVDADERQKGGEEEREDKAENVAARVGVRTLNDRCEVDSGMYSLQ